MDELDNFLEDELGEINDMFQEFQTKDKVSEERRRKEEQDLQNMELKLKSEHEVRLPLYLAALSAKCRVDETECTWLPSVWLYM